MRNARTINLAVVSRRDLYYVSENTSFCFGEKWAKIGNRSQTSCVNEKGGGGVLDLYTDALSTCIKGQLLTNTHF